MTICFHFVDLRVDSMPEDDERGRLNVRNPLRYDVGKDLVSIAVVRSIIEQLSNSIDQHLLGYKQVSKM